MKYRLIPVQEMDAYMNMAFDEVIMQGIAKGTTPPTIRFYMWNPSAVSIGYFQGYSYEVDEEACKKDDIDIVRRITGGGAVFHDKELTYSLLAPEDEFPRDITQSYKEICECVVRALSEVGIESEFSPINDVLAKKKKISGSAQTRRRGVLLQHGTILYEVDVDKMFTYLTPDSKKADDKLISSVKKRVTSVLLQNKDVTQDMLAKALEKAFSKGRRIEIGDYTDEERAKAKELSERYKSEAWVKMR
jgi:lipoate-protein ligase A